MPDKGVFKSLFVLAATVIMSACSSKATIRALEPAEIDRAASVKKVAVLYFENDHARDGVNFAAKLEAILTSYQIDDKNYFTVISHNDLDHILDAQKRQHSGLYDDNKVVELGKLTGAQAIISGAISSASSNDTRYRETRTRDQCDSSGKNCTTVEYDVSCTTRVIGLGVQVRMVDIERGDLITAQSFDASNEWSACRDRKETLPSRSQGLEKLSVQLAQQFVSKITPRYISFNVSLLDDVDISLSGEQEERFEAAIAFAESGRTDRAEYLFTQLHQEVQHQSYAIAYNLGVIKESKGDYGDAKRLYQTADHLALEPIDEINQAIERIDRIKSNSEKALDQLKRG